MSHTFRMDKRFKKKTTGEYIQKSIYMYVSSGYITCWLFTTDLIGIDLISTQIKKRMFLAPWNSPHPRPFLWLPISTSLNSMNELCSPLYFLYIERRKRHLLGKSDVVLCLDDSQCETKIFVCFHCCVVFCGINITPFSHFTVDEISGGSSSRELWNNAA